MGIASDVTKLRLTGFSAQREECGMSNLTISIKYRECFPDLYPPDSQMVGELWSEDIWLLGIPWSGKIKLRHY